MKEKLRITYDDLASPHVDEVIEHERAFRTIAESGQRVGLIRRLVLSSMFVGMFGACKGLEQKADGSIVVRDKHLVEITLLRSCPCLPPFCRMFSPVYHPNIAPHAICIGDYWTACESLVHIIIQIDEMIAFQRYNTRSQLNGQAAKWIEENMVSLPTDDSPLLLSDYQAPPMSDRKIGGGGKVIQPPATQSKTYTEPVIIFRCPACNTKLSAKQKYTGLPVTCPKCGSKSRIPCGVENS